MPSIKKSKQVKEEIRKKVIDEIAKNPSKMTELKKKSTPKKQFHLEFKRLMRLFTESCKIVNSDTINDVRLASDEVVHHLSLNPDKAYCYSFIYIRQLALTLRKAIAQPTKAAVYSVYNWQYIRSLQLWTDFLVLQAGAHPLTADLIHPLVEIIAGVVRFRPSARYLPVRFHCLKMLNQITAASKTLTPMLVNVIEIFNRVDFHQKCKKESKTTMNLMVMLHFSQSQLGTFEHLEIVIDQMFQMIVENLYVYACDPAFPEYSTFLVMTLKDFSKRCKIAIFRNAMRSLTTKITEHADFVRSERLLKPLNLSIDKDPAFEQFVDKYRTARINELEKVMEATKHERYSQPHEDYHDETRDLNEEDGASDLDEDEFEGEEVDYDSAVEIEDEDDEEDD